MKNIFILLFIVLVSCSKKDQCKVCYIINHSTGVPRGTGKQQEFCGSKRKFDQWQDKLSATSDSAKNCQVK